MDEYLIDEHKLHWHLDRVKEWQEKRIIPPIYIEVSPVSYCNHQCIFCGLDFAKQKGIQLDSEIFCKQLKKMGQLGVRSIMYAGEGEPLLHKDLAKFVKTTKENGIDVSITTNGTIENRELWKEILPHLTWIRFSVDAGTSKIYAKVHNVPESLFDITINNIKESIKIKKKYKLGVTIGIQFLVIEENFNDIENALRLFSALGIDYISLKPFSWHSKMINKKDTVYTPEMIQRIEDIVNKYRENTKINIIFRKDAMEKYINKKKKFNHCRALAFWGYISAEGLFYTCEMFIGDDRFKIGNIYNEDMQNILFGNPRVNSLAYGEKELDVESECRLNCRMARVNEFLEFLESKPRHINFI